MGLVDGARATVEKMVLGEDVRFETKIRVIKVMLSDSYIIKDTLYLHAHTIYK